MAFTSNQIKALRNAATGVAALGVAAGGAAVVSSVSQHHDADNIEARGCQMTVVDSVAADASVEPDGFRPMCGW
jgi:hypothetical protein